MVYAEIIGGVTAVELPQNLPFKLSSGTSFPGNWLTIATQAEREALNIFPIVDDAYPGFEYIVTGSTLAVTGGGTSVARHWTTTAKTATQLRDEMEIEVDSYQSAFVNTIFNRTIGGPLSDYGNCFDCNDVASVAIEGLARIAQTVIDGGGGAALDLNWHPDWGSTDFYLKNSQNEEFNLDAPGMITVANAMSWHKTMHMLYRRDVRDRIFDAVAVDDIPELLVIRAEYVDQANWIGFTP
jgi:hypothetical protein